VPPYTIAGRKNKFVIKEGVHFLVLHKLNNYTG